MSYESDKDVILLDCDGVIIDTHDKFMHMINAKFGTNYKREDIQNYRYEVDLGKEIASYILEELWHLEDLYDDLEPTNETMKMIDGLHELGHVIVISAPMAGHATSKLRFLKRIGFARDEIVLTWDKAALERAFPGALLIDDSPSFLSKHSGPKIVYDHPYNRDMEYPDPCLRATHPSHVYWHAINLLNLED